MARRKLKLQLNEVRNHFKKRYEKDVGKILEEMDANDFKKIMGGLQYVYHNRMQAYVKNHFKGPNGQDLMIQANTEFPYRSRTVYEKNRQLFKKYLMYERTNDSKRESPKKQSKPVFLKNRTTNNPAKKGGPYIVTFQDKDGQNSLKELDNYNELQAFLKQQSFKKVMKIWEIKKELKFLVKVFISEE